MKKLALLLTIVLLLAACSPAPEPEIVEVTVPVEVTRLVTQPPKIVEVTVLVTQPPLPTYTPHPTYTPRPPHPTYTPYPTYTLPPESTVTPEPTATSMPTPLPAPVVPEDWQTYESLDGSFTVGYPGSWGIQEEGVQKVVFDIPGLLFLQAALIEDGGDVFGEDDEENIRIHTTQIAETWSDMIGYTGFKVIDKGLWEGDVYKGYFCEFIVYKEEFLAEDIPIMMYTITILSNHDAVLVAYSHLMTKNFTADDRAILEDVTKTIRVK